MGILRRKEEAKAQAANLAKDYNLVYSDDGKSYQLVHQDTGKRFAGGVDEYGGLGTEEGLFTPHRRYKRLIGREVEKQVGQREVQTKSDSGDSNAGDSTQQQQQQTFSDPRVEALETKITDLEKIIAGIQPAVGTGSQTKKQLKSKLTKKPKATEPIQPAAKEVETSVEQSVDTTDQPVSEIDQISAGLESGESFRYGRDYYKVGDSGKAERVGGFPESEKGSRLTIMLAKLGVFGEDLKQQFTSKDLAAKPSVGSKAAEAVREGYSSIIHDGTYYYVDPNKPFTEWRSQPYKSVGFRVGGN